MHVMTRLAPFLMDMLPSSVHHAAAAKSTREEALQKAHLAGKQYTPKREKADTIGNLALSILTGIVKYCLLSSTDAHTSTSTLSEVIICLLPRGKSTHTTAALMHAVRVQAERARERESENMSELCVAHPHALPCDRILAGATLLRRSTGEAA
jgi:hypothetical protein